MFLSPSPSLFSYSCVLFSVILISPTSDTLLLSRFLIRHPASPKKIQFCFLKQSKISPYFLKSSMFKVRSLSLSLPLLGVCFVFSNLDSNYNHFAIFHKEFTCLHNLNRDLNTKEKGHILAGTVFYSLLFLPLLLEQQILPPYSCKIFQPSLAFLGVLLLIPNRLGKSLKYFFFRQIQSFS